MSGDGVARASRANSQTAASKKTKRMGTGPRGKPGTAAEVIKGNGELSAGKLRPDAAHYSHHRTDNQSVGNAGNDREHEFTKRVKIVSVLML